MEILRNALSREDKARLENTLSQWHALPSLRDRLEVLRRELGEVVGSHPWGKPWREMHFAEKFGKAIDASQACWSTTEPVDFSLKVGGEIVSVQLAEVYVPGARRAEHYRQRHAGGTPLPPSALRTEIESSILDLIVKGIQKKVDMLYDGAPDLVLAVNVEVGLPAGFLDAHEEEFIQRVGFYVDRFERILIRTCDEASVLRFDVFDRDGSSPGRPKHSKRTGKFVLRWPLLPEIGQSTRGTSSTKSPSPSPPRKK